MKMRGLSGEMRKDLRADVGYEWRGAKRSYDVTP